MTELFRTIENGVARVAPPGAPVEAELARRLGGTVSADGALFSLPELAFVNIRKGSFTHTRTDSSL